MQGWFRAVDSQNVMGRVVEVDKVHAAQSREAGREITFKQPVMESKVAGSSDISHQQIKEWNKKDGFMPQVEKVERFDYRWMQVSRKVNP